MQTLLPYLLTHAQAYKSQVTSLALLANTSYAAIRGASQQLLSELELQAAMRAAAGGGGGGGGRADAAALAGALSLLQVSAWTAVDKSLTCPNHALIMLALIMLCIHTRTRR